MGSRIEASANESSSLKHFSLLCMSEQRKVESPSSPPA
ncbi:predicted protein [Botrytis cinerea T4]|uniref:Uncharacterized protein n=1 Tax=Botryotinia fuckeliana (strain T4) TaxID=999810 RepID=G2XWN6_BOTF4|nr:predicted protein [Botrytis cinerea T4]